jgi:hypothetical protein
VTYKRNRQTYPRELHTAIGNNSNDLEKLALPLDVNSPGTLTPLYTAAHVQVFAQLGSAHDRVST